MWVILFIMVIQGFSAEKILQKKKNYYLIFLLKPNFCDMIYEQKDRVLSDLVPDDTHFRGNFKVLPGPVHLHFHYFYILFTLEFF